MKSLGIFLANVMITYAAYGAEIIVGEPYRVMTSYEKYGCNTIRLEKQFTELERDGDNEAVRDFMGRYSSMCMTIKMNEIGIIRKRYTNQINDDMICFRPQGRADCYWITSSNTVVMD